MSSFASLIPEEITRAFAWTLIHSVWQGGLIALLAAGVILFLRKHRPIVRYTLLCILMALLPVLFTGTFIVYFNQDKETSHNVAMINASVEAESSYTLNTVQGQGESKGTWNLFSSKIIDNQANLLVLIWFIGFIFFLIRFTGSVVYVYRLKNHNIFPVDNQWEVNLRKLATKIGLKRQVRLAESALANIPLTVGYLKPVILLPLGTLSGVPPQQIDAILLHELAHILRKDYLINILQSIVEMLFFYHPATWWLSGMIRQEREHICDDMAVSINQDHLNYIKALTTMEELNSKSPLLVNALTGSRKKLLGRVKRLISPVKFRKGFGEGIIVFLIIIGLVSALSLNALSVIPNSYDLTGRESGGKVYNMLPFTPAGPDTIKAVSKSGNVRISVYSDTVTESQQKALQEMAESIDKKEGTPVIKEERYVVHVDSPGTPGPRHRQEQKVVVITSGDSTRLQGDSIVVVYTDKNSPDQSYYWQERTHHEYPVPLEAPEFHYYYSHPDMPDSEDLDIKVFRYLNDSIDTLIFMSPDFGLNMNEFQWNQQELEQMMKEKEFELQELQLSDEEMQDRLKDIQIEIEKEFPEGNYEIPQIYFNEPVVPPVPPELEIYHEGHGPSAERIIRQELRDDGLTVRGRKYVIELDAKAMHINGEKQPKEVYKKYSKLVESLEQTTLEGDETFKLIF